MEAFATYSDLEARLNRTFSVDERAWITTLLEDASTYLRDEVIGLQVFPQSQVTFTAFPSQFQVVLPQQPVISVDAVTRNGAPIAYTVRDGVIFLHDNEAVDVTFTFGYAVAPAGLKRWACVLVSQVLTTLELKLGLTVGGLSSVAIDDFKVSFADGGADTGMQLNDRNIALIRAQYAYGTHVVGVS